MKKGERFPLKLFNKINDENNNSIICWSEDGKNVVIKDKIKVLPLLKSKSPKAFHRQLNFYGFKKLVSTGNNPSDVYYLKDFYKGQDVKIIETIKKKDLKKILEEIKNNKNIEDRIDSYIGILNKSKNNINKHLLGDVLSFLVERKKRKKEMFQEIKELKLSYDKNSNEMEESDKNKTMFIELEEEE